MLTVFPDYYKEFQCIGSLCKHNCCIGWEIDIDPDSLLFYDTVSGSLGQRLQTHISREGDPHFILGEHERCPFLNHENLCDIILTLGEEHICSICTEHPRFRNELPGRIEIGLGLCCEEAARLILSKKEPTSLQYSGDNTIDDSIVALRDQIISILQDREFSIPERIEHMLWLCGGIVPDRSMRDWAKLLRSLERLDHTWTDLLNKLHDNWDSADISGFDHCMANRQTEYEQFLIYLIYRHFANASGDLDLAARASFAAFAYELIHALGAVLWTEHGDFSFQAQIELVRLFSSEIEYSDENLYILFDELC